MRLLENPFDRFRLPALLFAFWLLVGTVGYSVIEGWAPFDGFYMTVVTITTVGFGEIHPLHFAGRVFTSLLVVGGVGTMLYAFGVFAETMSEGHFFEYRRARIMERRLAKMRDHFILCGYGRTGTRVALEFTQQHIPFVVIDNNPDAIGRLAEEKLLHVAGDAASEAVLEEAGIARARGLISAVDSDERSVYITLTARSLRSDLYIISRAGQASSIRRLELAGANKIVSPYLMAGHRMAEFAIDPTLDDDHLTEEAIAPLRDKEEREDRPDGRPPLPSARA